MSLLNCTFLDNKKYPVCLVHIAVYDLLKFYAFCVHRSQSQAAKQQNTKKFLFFFFFLFTLMNERVNILTFSFQKVCWCGALLFLVCWCGTLSFFNINKKLK